MLSHKHTLKMIKVALAKLSKTTNIWVDYEDTQKLDFVLSKINSRMLSGKKLNANIS